MNLPPDFSLLGHTALVSGAGSPSGIGFAGATLLGQLGARLVVTSTTDRIDDRVTELRALGIDAHGFVARLESEAGVNSLQRALRRSELVPDILVNNAGMITVDDSELATGDITISLTEWNSAFAMNLTTAFLLTKAIVPIMRAAGWGRIINVSSLTGPIMAVQNDLAYATAKAGMVGFTRSLAVDEARHGITANAVAPGWISTGSQTEAERAEGGLVPLGRNGQAHEVASVIAWLASPGASYVTGQLSAVDGGNSIAEQRLIA